MCTKIVRIKVILGVITLGDPGAMVDIYAKFYHNWSMKLPHFRDLAKSSFTKIVHNAEKSLL